MYIPISVMSSGSSDTFSSLLKKHLIALNTYNGSVEDAE